MNSHEIDLSTKINKAKDLYSKLANKNTLDNGDFEESIDWALARCEKLIEGLESQLDTILRQRS